MSHYSRSRRRQFASCTVLLLLIAWRIYQDRQASSEVLPPQERERPSARDSSSSPSASAESPTDDELPPGRYQVERVVDGDTLLLRTRRGSVRVRLQGINTPETVKEDSPIEKWGPEASSFTKAFVRDAGGQLTVEVDGELRDQYGRLLAFLWDGKRMLNEELVRAGLARAKLGYDYSQAKKSRLRRAQQEAQRAGRGLWSE